MITDTTLAQRCRQGGVHPINLLRNRIVVAEQQSAQWSPPAGASHGSGDGKRIFDDVAASPYVTLRRFSRKGLHATQGS
ncbi:hypothetical protein I6F35_18290 [Bradyrhizobium sp. BRP22]|uniref:hypothetical protein n=1 Tax=Bradyrhizobium sp. BRP22 TaxID=2793821 RepID=UPI001CD442C4|nr:hypothetical protein [Bradyrhizobium sp. BRP22]MCA1455158.1 hypothetical protein [Bradyrhizobium sp. BRP22]